MGLRICYPFPGRFLGGSHLCILEVLKHINTRNFEPLVVVHREGQISDAFRDAGFDSEVLGGKAEPKGRNRIHYSLWVAANLWAATRFLHDREVDLVHVSDSPTAELWSLAAILARKPRLWHIHSSAMSTVRNLPRMAHRYVCVSRFVYNLLPERLHPYAQVVPNGFDAPSQVDRAQARAEILERFDIPKNSAIIGFCGRMVPVKRPDHFIDAAARILSSHDQPAVFILLGEDPDKAMSAYKRRADDLGIGDKVFFAGFQTNPQRWIAGFDILLALALYEAFGRIIIEAMQVGTPVIATDAGGHGEVIDDGETGLLVRPDSPDALAAATMALLGDEDLRARMAQAALANLETNYGAAKIAGQFENIYRELAG